MGALSVRHGPWSTSQPLSPAEFESVELVVLAETSGMTVAVRLENDAQQSFPQVTAATLAPLAWTKISVPMSALDPAGIPFDRIDVRNANGTPVRFFVDSFALVRR